jgi:hypothetical protein
MRRFLVVFAAFVLAPSVQANPVHERNLVGEWQNEDGTLLLEMSGGREAVFTVPTLRQGETTEPRPGRYFVQNGLWVLEVSDLNNRKERFQIVSLNYNTLNLLGRNEAKLTLYRIGARFGEFDRNRDGLLEFHEVKNTRLGLYFDDIDANKDAQLTQAEYVTYWRRFPPPVVIQR